VATECFSKTPSFVNNLSTEEKEMYWYLTPYAFDIVMSTFKSVKNINILSLNKETQSATIQSSEGVLLTSTIKCSCSFVTSMCLPCHHILKLRQIYNIPLHNPELYAERWTREYYAKVCRVIPTNNTEHIKGNQINDRNEIQNINIVTVEKKKILNAHEKYRSAHVEAKRLASLASEATGKQFEQRLMILKYIANAWEQDKNITTTEIGLY